MEWRSYIAKVCLHLPDVVYIASLTYLSYDMSMTIGHSYGDTRIYIHNHLGLLLQGGYLSEYFAQFDEATIQDVDLCHTRLVINFMGK